MCMVLKNKAGHDAELTQKSPNVAVQSDQARGVELFSTGVHWNSS